MINISSCPSEMSVGEVYKYVAYANAKYPNTDGTLDIISDGEYVELIYHLKERADVPFQRIRRITGYLVGDLSRFNNAKRAEVSDRVKHFRA